MEACVKLLCRGIETADHSVQCKVENYTHNLKPEVSIWPYKSTNLTMIHWASQNEISPYTYMKLCCYFTKILFTNTAISKRAKLENCQQSGNISAGPFTIENDLMFPVPMSKAIFKLNHSYYSTISADSIFTYPFSVFIDM